MWQIDREAALRAVHRQIQSSETRAEDFVQCVLELPLAPRAQHRCVASCDPTNLWDHWIASEATLNGRGLPLPKRTRLLQDRIMKTARIGPWDPESAAKVESVVILRHLCKLLFGNSACGPASNERYLRIEGAPPCKGQIVPPSLDRFWLRWLVANSLSATLRSHLPEQFTLPGNFPWPRESDLQADRPFDPLTYALKGLLIMPSELGRGSLVRVDVEHGWSPVSDPWVFGLLTHRTIYLLAGPEVHADHQGRFHHASGPAIHWPDGTSLWLWHGVEVPRRIIEDPGSITAAEVLADPNAERRRVLLERMGVGRFLQAAGASEIHRDRDAGGLRRLVAMRLPGESEPLVAVLVRCPSTGHEYALRVPPDCRTCHEAVAWTWGISESEYAPRQET